MKIRRIQPAFAPPCMSVRRKMSPKMAMKIQMAMNRKKNQSRDAKISNSEFTKADSPSRRLTLRARPDHVSLASTSLATGAETQARPSGPAKVAERDPDVHRDADRHRRLIED